MLFVKRAHEHHVIVVEVDFFPCTNEIHLLYESVSFDIPMNITFKDAPKSFYIIILLREWCFPVKFLFSFYEVSHAVAFNLLVNCFLNTT